MYKSKTLIFACNKLFSIVDFINKNKIYEGNIQKIKE